MIIACPRKPPSFRVGKATEGSDASENDEVQKKKFDEKWRFQRDRSLRRSADVGSPAVDRPPGALSDRLQQLQNDAQLQNGAQARALP